MSQKTPERRKTKRRPILDTFSLFVGLPRKGPHRLPLHDLSELGIGFDADIDGESPEDFPINSGDTLEIDLYLNQSLSIPLTIRVARVETRGEIRRVGAEIMKEKSAGYSGLQAFMEMLDRVAEIGRVNQSG